MTSTTRRLINATCAFGVLGLLLIGIPYGLCTQVGWPLPHGLPSLDTIASSLQDSYVPDAFIVKTLAVVVWLAWVELTVSLLLEIVALLRGQIARRRRFISPAQALVAYLVTALVALSTPSRPVVTQPSLAFAVAVTPSPSPVLEPADAATTPPDNETTQPTVQRQSYTVARRDTLWSIAERQLGDPYRWRQIFDLNVGKPQPHGQSLTTPDLIRPGWVLELPLDAAIPASVDTPPPSAPVASTTSVSESPTMAEPTPVTSTTTTSTPITTAAQPESEQRSDHVLLVSGSIVSLSLAAGISSALSVLRRRRRRNYASSTPVSDIVYVDPSIGEDMRRMHSSARAHDALFEDELISDHDTIPGTVAIARSNKRDHMIDLGPIGLLGVSGPSATGVARSIVANLLSKYPHVDVEVTIVTSALAHELIGHATPFSGLRIEDDMGRVIAHCEQELLGRARLEVELDIQGFAALRGLPLAEMLNLLVVIVRAPNLEELASLCSLAERGRNLGVAVIVVDHEDDSATLVVDNAHLVAAARPIGTMGEIVGLRAYTLTATEAEEMVSLVGSARRWDEPALPMIEPPAEPFAVPVGEEPEEETPVHLQVFGSPRISVNGVEVHQQLRAKALELAVFLALRPQGASVEVIGAALWPDANRKQVGERFSTVTSDLRRVLREATGRTEEKFIVKSKVYRLDERLFTCDLWSFTTAIERFKASDDVVALAEAIATYRDHLGGDACPEWAEDTREHFRRRSLDAFVRLAERREAEGDLETALEVLEGAMQLDLYEEEIYRRIMRTESALGRHDAARRTAELLRSRLLEIDLEPTPETEALMAKIYELRRQEQRIAAARVRRNA